MRFALLIPARRATARGGQAGQGLAEYSLILALIAMVCIVALTMLGADIASTMAYIGSTIEGARP